MKTLREYILEARSTGRAVGHFNFSTFDVAEAIVDAAKDLNLPVILGLSEGERDFVGIDEAVSWVRAIRRSKYESVFLNADHTYSFARVKEAVDAGFDMVIFDDAGGDIEKNIEEAKKCKEYIDTHNRKAKQLTIEKLFYKMFLIEDKKREVLFESELGYIGKSSKILSELPDGIQKTSPVDAKRFVEAVKPDLLAPAVGNVHGMLKDVPDPNLDEKLCGEIYNSIQIPLVLHGASGNTKEDIQSCIKQGVAVVHVNTEIRVAYKNALQKYTAGEEVAPYKFMKEVKSDVQKVVEEKLKIFNFLS